MDDWRYAVLESSRPLSPSPASFSPMPPLFAASISMALLSFAPIPMVPSSSLSFHKISIKIPQSLFPHRMAQWISLEGKLNWPSDWGDPERTSLNRSSFWSDELQPYPLLRKHHIPNLQEQNIKGLLFDMKETLCMRLMNIQKQIQQSQPENKEERFAMQMKVACSGETTSMISVKVIEQAMTRDWGSNFHKNTQVHQFILKAHLISFEARMYMLIRQPWILSLDTLLIDLDNSENKKITSDYYKFDFIYVDLRAYGIPKINRSLKLLKDTLVLVGTESEFHELQKNMLVSRTDYIWGIEIIRICSARYGIDHDPWTLCSSSVSYLTGTRDFCHGGLLTPLVARDHYPAILVVNDDDIGEESMHMDYEAAAPALKAPRLP